MLCSSAKQPPRGDGWLYEPKWDGFRALIRCDAGRTTVLSRSLTDRTACFPELKGMAVDVGRDLVLDGELVVFGVEGKPDFWKMWERGFRRRPVPSERRPPVTFVAFDLLALDGRSLVEQPYADRRQQLHDVLIEGPSWCAPEAS